MIIFSLEQELGLPWYDTKEGVARSLGSLGELNQMLAKRRAAVKIGAVDLNEFLILGRFYLDAQGNCGKACDFVPKEQMPEIPDVLYKDEFWDYVKENAPAGENTWISFSLESGIPGKGILCPCCGQGWEVANCHDTVCYSELLALPLDEFVGKTFAQLKAAYLQRTDALYYLRPDCIIRGGKRLDLGLAYANRGQMLEDGAVAGAYAVQKGDRGLFEIWKYCHQSCDRLRLLAPET